MLQFQFTFVVELLVSSAIRIEYSIAFIMHHTCHLALTSQSKHCTHSTYDEKLATERLLDLNKAPVLREDVIEKLIVFLEVLLRVGKLLHVSEVSYSLVLNCNNEGYHICHFIAMGKNPSDPTILY